MQSLPVHTQDTDMVEVFSSRRKPAQPLARVALLPIAAALFAGCASKSMTSEGMAPKAMGAMAGTAPSPDPRVGLRAGLYDAAEANWNMSVLSKTKPTEKFLTSTNSDIAFTGNYAIQGSYNGFQVWDISNPRLPALAIAYYCPASQSDVSVYKNLLFVSSESNSGRLDCGATPVRDTVSKERLRGIRIFDITDIRNPRYLSNVQTCRGSHTHTVLEDPKDKENVYIYVSGSAGIRSPTELPGCVSATPDKDPNSALFRIEVIKVPLANPAAAAIVASPRIFNDLKAPPRHGEGREDVEEGRKIAAAARARGMFTAEVFGIERPLPPGMIRPMLDSVVKARGGSGAATGADSAALRTALPGIIAKMIGDSDDTGPTQCHDITVYPGIGLAGGACEGYGLLIDIRNPTAPVRINAVADSNFSYWHSATFNNDGTKMLFSDEWGGGGQAKCRSFDKKEWGADAIFSLVNGQMQFQSYYKLPAAQTVHENCVAHNGSLIPIPGRDVMVQAWYQGGISVFDWTDAKNAREIAYFDRGPVDSTRMGNGGSWSVYWYNGLMISSEISRGLDIFELTPSAHISQNEIDAAKTVRFEYLNAQGQPKLIWPPSFALARSYADQLERSNGLSGARLKAVRDALGSAERASGDGRKSALTALATSLNADAGSSSDAAKVRMLAGAVTELAK
jgi:LVIVD repeat